MTPYYMSFSERFKQTSLTVHMSADEVRIYRHTSHSRDGRSIYFRCSRCDNINRKLRTGALFLLFSWIFISLKIFLIGFKETCIFFFLFKFFRQICIKLVAFFFLFVFLCALYVVLFAIYCKIRKLYVFRVLSNWEYCCCSFVVLRKRSKVRCVVKGIGVWNRLCEYTDASIFFHSQSIPSHPFSNKNDSIIGEV